jgi:hypothetical protein
VHVRVPVSRGVSGVSGVRWVPGMTVHAVVYAVHPVVHPVVHAMYSLCSVHRVLRGKGGLARGGSHVRGVDIPPQRCVEFSQDLARDHKRAAIAGTRPGTHNLCQSEVRPAGIGAKIKEKSLLATPQHLGRDPACPPGTSHRTHEGGGGAVHSRPAEAKPARSQAAPAVGAGASAAASVDGHSSKCAAKQTVGAPSSPSPSPIPPAIHLLVQGLAFRV